jgi:uncharacterized membrane protein YdcZ (DUF606 family)
MGYIVNPSPVFVVGATVVVNHATINFVADHSIKMAVAALAEWVLVGGVIGLVYTPRTIVR